MVNDKDSRSDYLFRTCSVTLCLVTSFIGNSLLLVLDCWAKKAQSRTKTHSNPLRVQSTPFTATFFWNQLVVLLRNAPGTFLVHTRFQLLFRLSYYTLNIKCWLVLFNCCLRNQFFSSQSGNYLFSASWVVNNMSAQGWLLCSPFMAEWIRPFSIQWWKRCNLWSKRWTELCLFGAWHGN